MDLLVIDCQNDFIDGSLAAANGPQAVEKIVQFLQDYQGDLRVFYSADFHPENHVSYKSQGGLWPRHCMAGSVGAQLSGKFQETAFTPTSKNTYYKGRDSRYEEYSAFEARNGYDEKLKEALEDRIYLAGIASEYCVRETAFAFQKAGKSVVLLKDLLGYIDLEDHKKNLEDLENQGIEIQ